MQLSFTYFSDAVREELRTANWDYKIKIFIENTKILMQLSLRFVQKFNFVCVCV